MFIFLEKCRNLTADHLWHIVPSPYRKHMQKWRFDNIFVTSVDFWKKHCGTLAFCKKYLNIVIFSTIKWVTICWKSRTCDVWPELHDFRKEIHYELITHTQIVFLNTSHIALPLTLSLTPGDRHITIINLYIVSFTVECITVQLRE